MSMEGVRSVGRSHLQRRLVWRASRVDQEGTVDDEAPQPAVPKPEEVAAEFRLVAG